MCSGKRRRRRSLAWNNCNPPFAGVCRISDQRLLRIEPDSRVWAAREASQPALGDYAGVLQVDAFNACNRPIFSTPARKNKLSKILLLMKSAYLWRKRQCPDACLRRGSLTCRIPDRRVDRDA